VAQGAQAIDLAASCSTPLRKPQRTPGRHGYVAYHPAPIPRRIEPPASTIRLLADAEASPPQLFEVEGGG